MSQPEVVNPTFSMARLLDVRTRTWAAVRAIAERIHVGMAQHEADVTAREVLRSLGLGSGWHRVIVRLGHNTVLPYATASAPEIVLGDDDIFFIDIGPIFDGYEGDGGDTFVVGDNPEHHRLRRDVKEVWNEVRALWFAEQATGQELYEYAKSAAAQRDWVLNLDLAGHRLAEFPHKALSPGTLAAFELPPKPNLWVLEISLLDPQGSVGAFYEDLLLADQISDP